MMADEGGLRMMEQAVKYIPGVTGGERQAQDGATTRTELLCPLDSAHHQSTHSEFSGHLQDHSSLLSSAKLL